MSGNGGVGGGLFGGLLVDATFTPSWGSRTFIIYNVPILTQFSLGIHIPSFFLIWTCCMITDFFVRIILPMKYWVGGRGVGT